MRFNVRKLRGTGNSPLINAVFELLWGIEVGIILVVLDYFLMSSLLEKLKVSCADPSCTQSMGYYIIYYLSVIVWMFAVAYPIFLFVKALRKKKKRL